MTIEEQNAIMATYSKWREHAEATHRAIKARGMKHYQASGLGQEYHGCLLHNSILAAKRGKPWPGVNVAEAKRARYLIEVAAWRPSRLLSEWFHRVTTS